MKQLLEKINSNRSSIMSVFVLATALMAAFNAFFDVIDSNNKPNGQTNASGE